MADITITDRELVHALQHRFPLQYEILAAALTIDKLNVEIDKLRNELDASQAAVQVHSHAAAHFQDAYGRAAEEVRELKGALADPYLVFGDEDGYAPDETEKEAVPA